MEQKDLVSIVVPVYNAEKYVDRCIESILGQSYTNIEVIIIDDSSKDNSLAICRKYSEQDKRVKVFSKENKGVSAARNLGIEKARGEYLMFADADDYIDKDMVGDMLGLLKENGADIAVSGWIYEDDTVMINHPIKHEGNVAADRNTAIHMIQTRSDEYCGYLWNKLFRSSMIKSNNIRLDEDLRIMEDLLFCIRAFLKAEKTVFTPEAYYHYYHHTDNATGNIGQKNINEDTMILGIAVWDRIYELLKKDAGQKNTELAQIMILCAVSNTLYACRVHGIKLNNEGFLNEKIRKYRAFAMKMLKSKEVCLAEKLKLVTMFLGVGSARILNRLLKE